MKGPEKLVIQRKHHPKLCCRGQQEKPLTVEEELKTLYLKDADLESVSEIKLQ